MPPFQRQPPAVTACAQATPRSHCEIVSGLDLAQNRHAIKVVLTCPPTEYPTSTLAYCAMALTSFTYRCRHEPECAVVVRIDVDALPVRHRQQHHERQQLVALEDQALSTSRAAVRSASACMSTARGLVAAHQDVYQSPRTDQSASSDSEDVGWAEAGHGMFLQLDPAKANARLISLGASPARYYPFPGSGVRLAIRAGGLLQHQSRPGG